MIYPVVERLIRSLAIDLGYNLSSHELRLYADELAGYPLERLCPLVLELAEDASYDKRSFPSLSYLRLRLKGL